ncbi:MAG: N-acetyltransferase [Rhodospirillales bacterium]|jgi:uncharacterized protein|nr:N-acetyltransferase [Rhodospirillales bacterium]
MPDGSEITEIKILNAIGHIPAKQWDACARDSNPTVSHAFLSALEDSGSVGGDAGWLPQHLAVFDESGMLAAAAPMYLKSHSYGEYVFDWGWADAFERAGGRYYPKLQSSVPFTPVTGPRLLVRPGVDQKYADALIGGMTQVCEQLGVSSIHVTFPTEVEWQRFGDRGFLQRTGEQFHWLNDGYTSFDDFLSRLSSRKRKNIRKEREKVSKLGLRFEALSGADLNEQSWDAFYGFYCNTSDRKWGQTYLSREFFTLLGERMAERTLLFMVYEDEHPVAGALNLVGRDALYGRNWGCSEHHKFLHFECCYYQAIDYAITHGLSRVEAGAQGPHKLQRGYLPTKTYSAHWIRDRGLRDAIERYLVSERIQIEDEIEILTEHSPFRKQV